ncbi:MAG TPA: malate dehydrogenase [Ignisphaera aggregans]|uniref:Malate dehydrogenase n=1 Tax=Ignisphaera aggregans TaxID=334771 RepID=A0A832YYB5_9CREN|nr:malate dehydrogenase [Ignisphaera aggregans]
MVPLVTIVGSGRVGTEIAKHILINDLADVVLIDIDPNKVRGEALDLTHMVAMLGIDRDVKPSTDYRDMSGSDVVVISAGIPRSPGMTREQLIYSNAGIVYNICKSISEYCPKAVVIIVTNPVDALTFIAWKATGFERERVMGFGSMLDSARMRSVIAKKLGVRVSKVSALVMGEHGEAMVCMFRYSYVDGTPVIALLSSEDMEEIRRTVRGLGAEIIRLRGYSSTHAPGVGVAMLVRAVLRDEKRVYPVTAILDGEYGYRGIPLAVPAVIGRRGIEKIIELELTDDERKELEQAAKKIVETIKQALPPELCADIALA